MKIISDKQGAHTDHATEQHNHSKTGTLTGTIQLTPAFFTLILERIQTSIDETQSQINHYQTKLDTLTPPTMPDEHRYLFSLIYTNEFQFSLFTIKELDIYISYIEQMRNYKQLINHTQARIVDLQSKLKEHNSDKIHFFTLQKDTKPCTSLIEH